MTTDQYTERDLRYIESFEDAVQLATRIHGSVVDLSSLNTPPVLRYRIVTVDGVCEVSADGDGRKIIIRHWKAIFRQLVRNDEQALTAMAGTSVCNYELECRPDVIAQLHDIGDIVIPETGGVAPWHPSEEQP